MGSKSTSGFTIIEVMLFLAVTGALTIAILAGAGATINQQRYRDSVSSLKSFLQAQYGEVANVVNDRGADWQCNSNGAVTQVENGGQPRGTSDCVIMGRLVTLNDTGTQLTASTVTGYRPVGAGDTAASDLDALSSYQMATAAINQETTEVNWGAHVVQSQNLAAVQPLVMLIARSPLSGAVLTFVTDTAPDNISVMVNASNMQQRDLCVEPAAGTLVGQRLAVRIAARAANQSAIEVPAASGEGAPCQG